MSKWNIELSYNMGFTVSGIEAETQEEAIDKAKYLVESIEIISCESAVEERGFEFDTVSYVQKED